VTGAPVRLSAILHDSWILCVRHALLVGMSIVGLFLFGMLVDLLPSPDLAVLVTFLFCLVAAYLQLLIVTRALRGFGLLPRDADPRRPTLGRFPSAILLGIIYGLGVLAGLVLLIAPGLLLAFRWYAALPAMVAEERRAADSLERSWELTCGHRLLLTQIGAIVVAFWSAATAACVGYTQYAVIPVWLIALFNALWAVALVLTSLLSVALYAQLLALRQGDAGAPEHSSAD
jgi:hypothetical protein